MTPAQTLAALRAAAPPPLADWLDAHSQVVMRMLQRGARMTEREFIDAVRGLKPDVWYTLDGGRTRFRIPIRPTLPGGLALVGTGEDDAMLYGGSPPVTVTVKPSYRAAGYLSDLGVLVFSPDVPRSPIQVYEMTGSGDIRERVLQYGSTFAEVDAPTKQTARTGNHHRPKGPDRRQADRVHRTKNARTRGGESPLDGFRPRLSPHRNPQGRGARHGVRYAG